MQEAPITFQSRAHLRYPLSHKAWRGEETIAITADLEAL